MLLPFNEFTPLTEKMNINERENGNLYWHVHISKINGNYILKKGLLQYRYFKVLPELKQNFHQY